MVTDWVVQTLLGRQQVYWEHLKGSFNWVNNLIVWRNLKTENDLISLKSSFPFSEDVLDTLKVSHVAKSSLHNGQLIFFNIKNRKLYMQYTFEGHQWRHTLLHILVGLVNLLLDPTPPLAYTDAYVHSPRYEIALC